MNLEMVCRVRFFAESYRLCVPELNSVGWQWSTLGQLVGSRQIQDGCRDPDELQNVFIFTLHHVRNIIYVCTLVLWHKKNSVEPFIIVSDYVHVCMCVELTIFYPERSEHSVTLQSALKRPKII